MDLQKITSTGTAIAVVGTGAFVGGNHVIDQQTGGPEKREVQAEERLRKIIREELFTQVVEMWPKTSGKVKLPEVKDAETKQKDYRDVTK
tara:strand:+ start:524 stop:793 length:270 start_codon:yes stop_codon:yes gene_type:complete